MAYPRIVTENVSALLASTPNTLQATGALISQGATTLSAGSYSLLTGPASLTSLLASSLALSSLAWSGGSVLATAAVPITGLQTGDTFVTTIAGASPTAYNGLVKATVTGASTFTYSLASNPGSETIPGTYTPPNQGELQSMVDTFFGQGLNQAVYVLELGAGNGTSGPPLLATFIGVNPSTFYSFTVPRLWDATSAYLALLAQFESLTSKTYFFTTTTSATYSNYSQTMKNVLALVEAPGLPLTEFTVAADHQHTLAYAPAPSNLMTPNCYAYQYGVTPYPSMGTSAFLQALLADYVNFIGTGAEGGLANTIIFRGTTLDGNDFAWWYAADWTQIQCDQSVAAAIIQGNNNKLSPLYYNQGGINTLQDVTVATVTDGVSYGLLNGNVVQTALDPTTFATNLNEGVYAGSNVVNAVPFTIYTQQNPNDYGNKIYKGLTVVAIPLNGINQIVFNVLVTNLIGSL